MCSWPMDKNDDNIHAIATKNTLWDRVIQKKKQKHFTFDVTLDKSQQVNVISIPPIQPELEPEWIINFQ